MRLYNQFDYSKPQTLPTGTATCGSWYLIKTFKDVLLILGGNTTTGIVHSYLNALFGSIIIYAVRGNSYISTCGCEA
jgi:hypothetical protein